MKPKGQKLFSYVCGLPGIETVLDVGAGPGYHSRAFYKKGKNVTGVDIRKQGSATLELERYRYIHGSVEDLSEVGQYDLVWCSHVLEHVRNPGNAIKNLVGAVRQGGYLAILVPPDPQSQIHVGHLTIWTPFLLLYNLVVNGVDCRGARWYTDHKNTDIGLVVQINDPIELDLRFTKDDGPELQKAFPIEIFNRSSAWIGDRWEEFELENNPS